MGAVKQTLIERDARDSFWRDGHTLLRGLAAPDEIGAYRRAISTAVEKYSTESRSLSERDTYGRAFVQVMNLWRRNEEVRRFVFERRFAQVAADLLGVEKVRLYHDQALFKEPHGGHTPWHQDQFYWPLDTTKTLTMWMPLVDISEEMGVLTFASGSHANGAVDSIAISDESERFFDHYITAKGFPLVKSDSMKAGDATFHLGWTIHSAGPNRSASKTREVMTVIYFADGARITEPANDFQKADLAAWLGGKPTGTRADGELNPVLS